MTQSLQEERLAAQHGLYLLGRNDQLVGLARGDALASMGLDEADESGIHSAPVPVCASSGCYAGSSETLLASQCAAASLGYIWWAL